MKNLLRTTALAASLFATSAFAQTFGPYPGQTYLECVPAHPSGVAVVLSHGSWGNGNASQTNVLQVCHGLAAAGIYVMDINYRLAYQAPWPAQLQDVQLATRTLRAKGYKIVGAVGTSAGGLISLMAGATAATNTVGDRLHEDAIWFRQNPRPDFVVDISGPADDVLEVNDGTPDGMLALMKLPIAQAEAALSAVNFVDCHMAPTIVFQGLHDVHTGVDQARELVGVLAKNNVPFQYQPYDGSHVLNGVPAADQTLYIAEAAAFALAHRVPASTAACGS